MFESLESDIHEKGTSAQVFSQKRDEEKCEEFISLKYGLPCPDDMEIKDSDSVTVTMTESLEESNNLDADEERNMAKS